MFLLKCHLFDRKVHHFLSRPHYHIVLEYFDIIEKTKDNRMVILKKKKNVNIPKELIEKYELIHC